ncbi:MAG: 4-(cytidine 5'-diphospho)-2-C-methyl-D-erythritol kinase [Ruminococcaceae bacterium]|nr:4-(cytidine 5'-diphospho)-2-C-methyl-D-erythritol kinase [Oscillospiraceae bacterium]
MKIKANAKINLSLNICGKREDGYHLIDTVMHSVGLFDELQIEKAESITVKCDKYDIKQEDNIAYRAAELFFEDYGLLGGADITIKKNIPSPAGLGGGSADAAAVLLALRNLYNADITDQQLRETALKLGADVPFFINGGCRRAEGIGECLTDLKPFKNGYIVLAIAEQKPSTGEMYRIIDSKPYITCDTEKVINAVEKGDLKALSQNSANSFCAVWEQSFVKSALQKCEPLMVSLSGSGPTWFAIFENFNDANKTAEQLKKQDINCFVTTFKEKAIEFE